MKILELTNFSSGICGVWQRVKQESEVLTKKGHEVRIFSSNFTKGSDNIAPTSDNIGPIKIKRFPAKKLGGESFMFWNFEEDAIRFKPDLIIAHGYRHLHTTKALKIAEKIRCKIFLVTHAPFIEDNSTRSFLSEIIVRFYDNFIGPKKLKKFNKIISITHWEEKYLLSLGVPENKIEYIPNGIPSEFFKTKKRKFLGKELCFLGRISPIKNLETLLKAFNEIYTKKNSLKLKIIGPKEEEYFQTLKPLIKNNISFREPIYDLKDKIKELNKCDIFILPSLREAMPQSLIEAMALGKVVISSKTQGAKEIISNKKNGFLFNIGDSEELARIILSIYKNKKSIKKIQRQVIKKAEEFSWEKIGEKLNNLIQKR